jgi:plastocyanin
VWHTGGRPDQETHVPLCRRAAVVVLVTALMMLAAGCQSRPSDQAARATPAVNVHVVVARDLAFVPPAVQIPAGTTVTWQFKDGNVPHNVQADGFKSKNLTKGTFQHRFDRPGTYPYVCTLHAGMTGRVVVVAG